MPEGDSSQRPMRFRYSELGQNSWLMIELTEEQGTQPLSLSTQQHRHDRRSTIDEPIRH